MASIVVIMLLLSKSIRKKAVRLEVLLLIMILDLLSVMIAFAAGSCRKLSTSIYVFLLVAGVIIYLVFLIVLSRAIGKCHKKWETVVLFCSRCAVCVSSTNTRVHREQV
jgi:zinc transporter ZupT